MKTRSCLLALVACVWGGSQVHGQADKVFLRLESGGPTSVLTAVAFSPDGERLYAAGFDKVVRVWALNKNTGTFELSKIVYRVPIAPGTAGTINALAVSPDGNSLAVGGLGVMRGRADFRTVGMVFPALGTKTLDMRKDEGTIFVFNVNNERQFKVLREHAGAILALSFLPAEKGKPSLLVSAAEEPIGTTDNYAAHVRLWDVSQATSLAEQTIDTKAPRRTPGLTAWHTGANPKDVSVALAWWDGQVRVWDVAAGQVEKARDGRENNTAGPSGTAGQFLTASFQNPDGVVRLWQAEKGKPPRSQTTPQIPLRADDPKSGPFHVPLDLVAFSSRPNGAIDRAVILARRQGAKPAPGSDRDVLFLLDLTTSKVLARHTLATFQTNMRRLTVSPTGQHIAIADADRQQVLVFSTTDLGETARPQVLRGIGTSFKVVSFRKKGDDLGLFLEDINGAKMVFDFNNRRLVADDDAWKKDTPNKTGWDVTQKKEQDLIVITVSGPDFKAKSFVLGEKCTVTAGALLPPRKDIPFGPVLALSWLDEHSQPMLALYDVASGTQVRQLAGHLAEVRSLSFTADGRLLASAAADQTVCLWSMISLDQVLDKAGTLSGVVVDQKDKNIVVVRVPDGSPLKKGAVIEGLVEGNKLRELASPREFYTAFFNMKPKTETVLRVRQPGAEQATDLKLTVGQGTDERKPLLSLFVTRDGEPAKREWIAWTSMGPYDASSRRAEDYLGWHFNPDKVTDPIDFARADKYRDKYEAKGILTHVVRHANAIKALEKWKEEPLPEMNVWIDGIDATGALAKGQPLTRTRALTLRLELSERFPAERVNAASLRLDNGPWQSFGEGQKGPWSADLSRLSWGRGPHVVGVRLEVDARTRQSDKTLAFHYLPESPRIEFAEQWLKKNFPDAAQTGLAITTKKGKNGTLVLEAEVKPRTPGEELRVWVRQNQDPPVTVKEPNVRHEFKLKEGVNILEIGAVNAKAAKDLEKQETTVRQVRVDYYRERAAPQFTLREVLPLSKGAVPIRVQLGQPVIVSVPKVRVIGQVVGEENLEEVKRENRALPTFEAGMKKVFDFKNEINLKKGEQLVLYQARSKNSPVGEGTIRLVYQPPVAQISAVRPLDESKLYQSEVELKVELVPPDHKEPYTAEVLVNGRRQANQDLDAGSTEFKAKLVLDPGPNRIVVRLHNQWKAETVGERQFHYVRPPRIIKYDIPNKEVDKAVQDFSAEVESPAELPPCEARLNDIRFRDTRFNAKLLNREKGLWRVTLRDVGLQEGKNTLTLSVANTDGEALKPATAQVRYTKPRPPKPTVTFKDFSNGENVHTLPAPKYSLVFRVQSTTPLKRVELRGENDAVLFQAKQVQLKGWAAEQPLEFAVPIQLEPGRPTTLRVMATNDGGDVEEDGRASRTLQVPDHPVYVVIDKLESLKASGRGPWLPRDRNDNQGGQAVFDVVTEGRVKLHGHIFWNKQNDELFRNKKINVRVFANGFQQFPTVAQPPKPGETECAFVATVLLTRRENNIIEVDLAGLKVADSQRNACVVRQCPNFIQGRRLHLAVIGLHGEDGEVLKKRALDAIGAERLPTREGRWQAKPTFERVEIYEPLVGSVSQGRMLNYLQRIKQQILTATPDDQNIVLGEVVLVYYQGREMVTPQGQHYLWSDDSKGLNDLKWTAVESDKIVKLFDDARGAQVVMLDVERVARADALAEAQHVDRAFEGTRLGVFYSVWSGQKVPPVRLLSLVQQSWPKVDNLDNLAKQIELLKGKVPQMAFDKHLPGQLTQLEFGGKR